MKITSEELAYKCYQENKPIDKSWIKYKGLENVCINAINGFCESEGINASKKLKTLASRKLYNILK